MKYIFLFFVVLGSMIGSVLGQSITLTPSTTTVDVNTTFGVTVQVEGITNPGEVQIQGIDKFTVRGQAQSTSMQINNGQQSLQIQLQLQLQPSASGSFVIGPARIAVGTGEILSNSFTVDVTGEKLFLQPQQASALLGVQEEQATDIPEGTVVDEQKNSSPHFLRWIIIVLGIGVLGGFFWKKKGLRTGGNDMKQHILPSSTSNTSFRPLLPDEDDEAFRTKMDLWWRDQLSKRTSTDCSSFTLQELESVYTSLSAGQQELFSRAFTMLQTAIYANGAGERHELLTYAHRLLTLSDTHE